MQAKQFLYVSAVVAATGAPTSAFAQWSPTHSIHRIGLVGPEHTGSAGLQSSTAVYFNAPGIVSGTSARYTGVNTSNGQDTWAWNGTTTTQLGFTDGVYTGTGGIRNSVVRMQNAAGHVVGTSSRYNGGSSNGEDAWVWNGTTTTQIGLIGGVYNGSAGGRSSEPRMQSESGKVAGWSLRYSGTGTSLGRDTWAWNGATTTQIGFTGGAYMGSGGLQLSTPVSQNAAGHVIGSSSRITGVNTNAGQDAWLWNGTTTTQLGFTGGVYTAGDGKRSSSPVMLNGAGQVAGQSLRYTGVSTVNGQDTWVWTGTSTVQIGLTGAGYAGSGGMQSSNLEFQNAAGHVVGRSDVIAGANTFLGQDTWIWNGTTTTPIGLTGAAYSGGGGYRYGKASLLNAAGQVAGFSLRAPSSQFISNGQDAWVSNGTTTTQIGLTSAAHTGSGGRRTSFCQFQNDAGRIAGFSLRYTGLDTDNGRDTWMWNGATTTQIGLTGGVYTGTAGYQFSETRLQNSAGRYAGISHRITGANTQTGQDTWYVDPGTGLTTAVIGSIRTSDGRAFSEPTILTDDGYLLGSYTFYAGGAGEGEQRAFIYRPDRGLTDLGNLVNGGLTAQGWSTLKQPLFADALSSIVGHGFINGQLQGQSVFVMKPGSTPGCPADLGRSGGEPGSDGVLDNNDFIAFINYFFNRNPLADTGSPGGVAGSDGLFDNNDFIVFINQFFAGC